MFSRKISRRELLKILFWGSTGTAVAGLGFSRFETTPLITAGHSSSMNDPSHSKLRYGNAKVTIIQDGSVFYAMSDDASVIYSGTDPTNVIHQGFSKGLTIGRVCKEMVKLKGSFLNLRTILIPSYVTLDLSEAYLKQADATRNHLLTNEDKANGGSSNIDILSGIIDGNKTGNGADFDDLGFPGDDKMNTIHLEKVKDCNIHGIKLIYGYYHGLRIRNAINVLISNCTLRAVSRESISISGQSLAAGACKKIGVFNNSIFNSGNSAISTLKTSDVVISGNICDTIVGQATGITINGLNNQVVNNSIKNSYLDLISIAQLNLPDYDASGSIVSGNICQGARFSNGISSLGHSCKNLIIANNSIADVSEGIAISSGNQNFLIVNNIIHSCRNSGIRVSWFKGLDIKNIRISNNMCYNNGAARDINEWNKVGIRIRSEEVGPLHDCVIENNSCFDDRQEGRTQDYGIRVENAKDCFVRYNYTKNNIIAGIKGEGNVGVVSHENVGQT